MTSPDDLTALHHASADRAGRRGDMIPTPVDPAKSSE